MQVSKRVENPILEQIVNELIEKFKCHTVLLYGSHARGDATSKSDYDAVDEASRLKLPSLYLWTENLESMYLQLGWRMLERTQFHDHDITVMRRDFIN